jgi:capping protein alpha
VCGEMSDYSEQIPGREKVFESSSNNFYCPIRIISNFIKSAPPGEFNEVFNDVRVLLDDDQLLKEGASSAFAQYNMEQFTPAKVNDDTVLVTTHGQTEGSKYLDPRNKLKFKYDHLRKEASEPSSATVDDHSEPFRAALDKYVQGYVKDHYPNGIVTVRHFNT